MALRDIIAATSAVQPSARPAVVLDDLPTAPPGYVRVWRVTVDAILHPPTGAYIPGGSVLDEDEINTFANLQHLRNSGYVEYETVRPRDPQYDKPVKSDTKNPSPAVAARPRTPTRRRRG